MTQGAYKVTDDAESRKIECDLVDGAPDPIPPDQLQLTEEVGKTLTVLQMLFDPVEDKERFLEYFRPLVSIARDGLEGSGARPDVAKQALATLQTQVTTREAGRVKHRYMKRLAKYAGVNSALLLLLAFVSLAADKVDPVTSFPVLVQPSTLACFFLLLSGCAAGVWLSFGARRPTLTFYELHIPEPDQLHPAMRVAFVLALTVIVALLFDREVLTVGIGNVNSKAVFAEPAVSWLIGALCGFSEQLLSKQVTEQASRLFPSGSAANRT